MTKFIIVLVCSCFMFVTARADESKNFDDSLNKVQALLKDHGDRAKAVSETKEAQEAHEQLQKLAPDQESQDDYYELAAEILENYRDAKDEDGMKKSISDGQRDPSSFYKSLTPEQRTRIKALSEKLNPGAQSNP